MDVDIKTYTFKSESSKKLHHHPFNSQPANSPTFKTSERAQSLPLKQSYKNTSHSESSGLALTNSRLRRRRIFQEHKSNTQQQSFSSYKKKRNSIFGQSNRGHEKDSEKTSLKEKKFESTIEQSLKSPFQCKQLIEKKLTQRLGNSGFGSDIHIKEKVALKQREIRYLKMEIDRLKRCETINRQNDDICRRLAIKLKERANQSYYHKTNKQPTQAETPIHRLKPAEAETPIHSLKQIKFALPSSQTSPQQILIKIDPSQPMHTVPLKTIPENQQNQLYTQSKTEAIQNDRIFQLKATPNTKDHRKRSSPPKQEERDEIYLKIKQKLNENNHNSFKRNINDIPLNYRLQEMNRQLECSYNSYSKRINQRPQSQSSQKTKRVDQSLKKSHYYIMMQ